MPPFALPHNFDANAAAAHAPAAWDAYVRALALPARAHADALAEACGRIALALDARGHALLFVAGGSEANALALGAGARAQRLHARAQAKQGAPQPWLHMGATEHASVRACAEALCGPGELHVLRCDAQGRTLVPRALPAGTRMVALTRACSETGVLQNTSAQVAACRAAGAWAHVDAVQAAGRVPLSFAELGADSMALAGHKLGAVGAIGVLVVHGARRWAPPAWAGAQRRRVQVAWAAGTARSWAMPAEAHLPSILSLAAALEASVATRAAHAARASQARDALEARLRQDCPPVHVLGGDAERLPNTSCLHLPGCSGEAVTMALDVQEMCISQGSACSSGASRPSPTPQALGLTAAQAAEVVRISLAPPIDAAALEQLAAALVRVVRQLRRGP